MKNHTSIILIGGGGHCKACIDVIETQGKYQITGILDVSIKVDHHIINYPVIGTDEDILNLAKQGYNFLITIGQIKDVEKRRKIFEVLTQLNAKLPVIESSYSIVSKHSIIDQGTIIMHNAVVSAEANIGANCIINTKALVEHETVIGEHTHVSTGAVVNGNCVIGKRCFIGSNAVINQGIVITDDVIIGAGTIVNKDINKSGVYVGTLARRIK